LRLLFSLLFWGVTAALAQERTVSGTVTDDAGKPVSRATVQAPGAVQATSTGEDGRFRLTLPAGAKTLKVSSVGFIDQEVTITEGNMVIKLESAQVNLDDVVVVGYGVQRVTKVSGAVSSVKGSEIEKLKPVRAEDALQGRASGVTVVSTGSPGVKPTVLIRGIPSYTGTDPVVVVDGSIQTLDDFNSIRGKGRQRRHCGHDQERTQGSEDRLHL